jgi:ATP-dependent RNA helicase MSS116
MTSSQKTKNGFLSSKTFASLPIDRRIIDAIHEKFGYEFMSEPQSLSIPAALSGNDVFVKAKTGSGKTLAFLIPAINNTFSTHKSFIIKNNQRKNCVRILILSPSRELAMQTCNEASKLVSSLGSIGVQLVMGGTDIKKERNRLQRERIDIIVATPGRLNDHLENEGLGEDTLSDAMVSLSVLVLDEADRLLDSGFAPALERISKFLPSKDNRQTLLFTATVPPAVLKTAEVLLRKNYTKVMASDLLSSSKKGVGGTHNVTQSVRVFRTSLDMYKNLNTLLSTKRSTGMSRASKVIYGPKIIVFLPTARMAQMMAEAFRGAGMPDALELHSRLSQAQRIKVTKIMAAETRSERGVIVFASDVIARGVDFPDVTLVVQVGLTDSEQYVHRVGRTGRGGKNGEAVALLLEDEASRLLKSISLHNTSVKITLPSATKVNDNYTQTSSRTNNALVKALREPTFKWESAFVATLGFYNSNRKQLGWDKPTLVRNVKERFAFFAQKSLEFKPKMSMQTLKKMQLSDMASEFYI